MAQAQGLPGTTDQAVKMRDATMMQLLRQVMDGAGSW